MEPTSDPARLPQAPADLEALLGGRGLQIAGLLSLFGSGAFFFKLAVDHGWLDPLVRVLIGAAAGLALLSAGVAHKRGTVGHRAVSEGLIALGAALLFLTAWAAGPLFGLIPNLVALGTMGAVTAVLTAFALRMRSQVTAIYGLVGGLLAPELAPPGDARIVLAAYLLALCGAALFAAERGRFRPGVIAPLAMAGALVYAQQFAADTARGWTYLHTLAVLTLFFSEFAWAAIGQLRRGATRLDLTVAAADIAFLIAFAWADLAEHHFVLAPVLVAAAVFVGGVARSLPSSRTRVALWWITGAIATLAVLPALDLHAHLAASVWVLEGAAFYAFGVRIGYAPVRFAALALLVLAAPAALGDLAQTAVRLPFLNADFGKALCVATALVVVALESHAFALRRVGEPVLEDSLPFVASMAASIVALGAIVDETLRLPDVPALVHAFGSGSWPLAAVSIVATIYAVGLFVAGHVRDSRNLRSQSLGLFALVLIKVVVLDLATVEMIYRVATLFGVGVATLAISAVYLRRDQVQRFFVRPAE
jgi:uncharacterized membrane protein